MCPTCQDYCLRCARPTCHCGEHPEERTVERPVDQFYANCTCPWTGANWDDLSDATDEAHAHHKSLDPDDARTHRIVIQRGRGGVVVAEAAMAPPSPPSPLDTSTWTDQPEAVGISTKLAGFMVGRNDNRVIIEVRRDYHGAGYYITAGNLFGSQTVLCQDPEAMLRAIEFIHNGGAGKKGRPLPKGCTMVENKKATA